MIRLNTAAAAGLLLLTCGPAFAQESRRPRTMPAQAFVRAIGMNTHLAAFYMSYGPVTKNGTEPQAIVERLRYLGISLIRDGMPSGDPSPKSKTILSELGTLADDGIRLDLLAAYPQNIKQLVAGTDELVAAHRGAVASIEGPNEVTDAGFAYEGANGPAGVLKYQAELMDTVHASSGLSHTPIYNFSLLDTVHAAGQTFGTKVPADFINVHAYASQPTLIAQRIAIARQMDPGGNFVVTEGGFYTDPNPKAWGSVSQPVQAKLLLNWLMDVANQGAKRTFIYELLDNAQDKAGAYSPENHFGLYDIYGRPKLAAAALHNLTQILGRSGGARDAGDNNGEAQADGGGERRAERREKRADRRETRHDAEAPDTPRDESPYTIDGLPPSGNSLLLSKGHGVFDLVVWTDEVIWNRQALSEINPPPVTATIHLGGGFHAKALYDPIVGVAPKPVQSASADVQLHLGGSPLILEIARGRTAKNDAE